MTTVKPGLAGRWLRVSRNPQLKGIRASSSPPPRRLLPPHMPHLGEGAPVHLSPPSTKVSHHGHRHVLLGNQHARSFLPGLQKLSGKKGLEGALGVATGEEGRGWGRWRKESVCRGQAGAGGGCRFPGRRRHRWQPRGPPLGVAAAAGQRAGQREGAEGASRAGAPCVTCTGQVCRQRSLKRGQRNLRPEAVSKSQIKKK